MFFDIATPIRNIKTDRNETMIVCFEGFIKNSSEGMIRTMKRDYDIWIEKYPQLSIFNGLTQMELYDQTLLFPPKDVLYLISDGKLSEGEIQKDIDIIFPDIFWENARMTTFEFSLFQLLQEGKIKKCYIYKETPFYENDIQYLQQHYGEVWSKIELVSDVSFESLYHAVEPTTICTYDASFVFDYVQNKVAKEEKSKQYFLILNTIHTVHQDSETNECEYYPEFLTNFNKINNEKIFIVSPMYNFQIDFNWLSQSEPNQ